MVKDLKRIAERIGEAINGFVFAMQIQKEPADRRRGMSAIVEQVSPINVASLGGVLFKGFQQIEGVTVGDAGLGKTLSERFSLGQCRLLLFVDEQRFLWTDRVEYACDRTRAPDLGLEDASGTRRLPLGTLAQRRSAMLAVKAAFKSSEQGPLEERVAALEEQLDCRLADAAALPAIYAPLTWDEVRALSASGLVTIGSHTHTHRILGRCTDDEIRAELATSKRLIEKHGHAPCDLFCYPNGREGDFSEASRRLLEEQGFRCALTTVRGNNRFGADPFTLRRFNVPDHARTERILLEAVGLLH